MTSRSEKQQVGKGLAFLSPWVLGFLVLTIIPVGLSFYYSFTDYALLNKPVWVGWDNYRDLIWATHRGNELLPQLRWNQIRLDDDTILWTFLYKIIYYFLVFSVVGLIFSIRPSSKKSERRFRFRPWLLPLVIAGSLWAILWIHVRCDRISKYGDPHFWTVIWNTFYYSAMSIPAGLIVSFGLACLLNVKTRGQAIYRAIIFLPSLVPAVAGAVLWSWLLNPDMGLVNTFLKRAGVIHPPGWTTVKAWAMPSLVFMGLWGVGNTVVIYLAGLQDVPRELYEAADIDGAGVWRRLWYVTIPMVSPVIFFNLIMAIIGSLQVFTVPMIMTGGNPEESTRFFTMMLYDNAFLYLKMGYASAMAWIQLLIVLSLTAIAFMTSRKWVHYSGK